MRKLNQKKDFNPLSAPNIPRFSSESYIQSSCTFCSGDYVIKLANLAEEKYLDNNTTNRFHKLLNENEVGM